ncbi:MAG: lexA [Chitinophagaceae bacterium]|nr:lexA [Chitinophagaceae bacterium]
MTLISNNIKVLRKKAGFTQEQLSAKIGIKRSVLGAYEEGRAEPGLQNLLKLSSELNISVDDLISLDFSDEQALTSSKATDLEGKKLRVLAITVNADDKEGIQLVPQKAAAGYLNGYQDPEYISELPVFLLPIFQNGTFRAFEIKGDSMLPLNSGSIIVGQYMDNWKLVKEGKTYVVVTRQEGIVYKRLLRGSSDQVITLKSDNPSYPPYELSFGDIMEVWEAKAYVSKDFPDPDMSVEKLGVLMGDLQKGLNQLRKS